MLQFRRATLAACLSLLGALTAQAGPVSLSVGIGLGPAYRPYPYYRPYHGYYRPVYLAPPPPVVYVEERPVIVRPTTIVQPVYQAQSAPPPEIVTTPSYAPPPQSAITPSYAPPPPLNTTVVTTSSGDPQSILDRLRNPQEQVRIDAVMDLGRARADQNVEPLAATLAGDASPAVRDAAARALGILGSPRGLLPLTRAAQSDSDRDVRRSAQFAVEIIQSNQRR